MELADTTGSITLVLWKDIAKSFNYNVNDVALIKAACGATCYHFGLRKQGIFTLKFILSTSKPLKTHRSGLPMVILKEHVTNFHFELENDHAGSIETSFNKLIIAIICVQMYF